MFGSVKNEVVVETGDLTFVLNLCYFGLNAFNCFEYIFIVSIYYHSSLNKKPDRAELQYISEPLSFLQISGTSAKTYGSSTVGS